MREAVGFIAPIEGMRGVAVLLVMLFHYAVVIDPRFADPWLAAIDSMMFTRIVVRNGLLGVDIFFLITGFLLVLPWLRHAGEGLPAPVAIDFYRRRVLRILPAYYVHLLVLFFVLVPLVRGLEYWRYDPAFMFDNLWSHILLVHYLMPTTSASAGVNGALWTLSLEAQFYLLLPLIAPVFARAPRRTALCLVAAAITWRWMADNRLDAIVAHLRELGRFPISEVKIRHFLATQLPGYLGHFAVGMLAARVWLRRRDVAPSARGIAAWLAVAILALGAIGYVHAPGRWILGAFTWILVLGALGVVFTALVAHLPGIAAVLLGNRALRLAGRLSYSAYLYHLPVILLWNTHGPPMAGAWLVLPAYLASVFAIAWISWRYVEVPGMRPENERSGREARARSRADHQGGADGEALQGGNAP